MFDFNAVMLVGVKYMFIIAGILNLLFAYLITRQIALMSRTIKTTASVNNKVLGFIYLVISILSLIYFIIVLWSKIFNLW